MRTRFSGAARALPLLLAAACSGNTAPSPAPQQIPAPDPAQVDRVIFLYGDPGEARVEHFPIVTRLQQDVEWWAERLPRDSAVAVLYLGDLVYPLGLNPPGSDAFPEDSAVVESEVRVVAGPNAVARRAQGYLMAGNHDWGLESEWEGYVRLKRLDEFLARARARTGAQVQLVPRAGSGGPFQIDLGEHVRLLILDTAWWVLDGGRLGIEQRSTVLSGVEEAIRTAGRRSVLIAAHHPFKSAGPHGGEFSFWRTFGVRYVLARSGAILQDLSSVPYRELERGLRKIFERRGVPLAFIGGHEHSLQVIGAVRGGDPTYSIVSGSGSKLSSLGSEPGLQFGLSAPGYMRLVVERDGGVTLFIEAAPPEFKSCPKSDPERARCMAEGVASFRTVHSQRLR